jgi:hypothetical protein
MYCQKSFTQYLTYLSLRRNALLSSLFYGERVAFILTGIFNGVSVSRAIKLGLDSGENFQFIMYNVTLYLPPIVQAHPAASLAIAGAGSYIAYCIGLVIYRLYFSPLELTYAIHIGPIVRINPSVLCINDPEAYDEIYVSEAKRKTSNYQPFGQGLGFDGESAHCTLKFIIYSHPVLFLMCLFEFISLPSNSSAEKTIQAEIWTRVPFPNRRPRSASKKKKASVGRDN